MSLSISIAPVKNLLVCVVLLFYPLSNQVLSLALDYEESGKFSVTRGWCYMLESCKESSPNSDWQRGTCKSGQRQSPIDIKTASLTPVQKRKRRAVALRRDRTKGKMTDNGEGKMFGGMYPEFPSSEEKEGIKEAEEREMGGHLISFAEEDESLPKGLMEMMVDAPVSNAVKVKQGLLCSPQPHWNTVWMNGKPYQYWIEMHLCRLIFRQRAQFVVKQVKQVHPERPSTDKDPIIDQPTSTLRPLTPPPIKIDLSESRKNYVIKEFMLRNNGWTILLTNFVSETGMLPTFTWPDQQNGLYELAQIHFHWGARDDLGSEHTVDGQAFSGEMQLVHFRTTDGNSGFRNLRAAVESGISNAVAVIAVFLQADDTTSLSFLQPHIINNLASVPRKGDKMTVSLENNPFRLDSVLEKVTKAYHYLGSFTAPKGCYEVVAWLVCKEPINISRKEIEAFRSSVREGNIPLVMNYRSVQNNKQLVSLIGIKQE